MSALELRILLVVIGLIVLGLMFYFGTKPKHTREAINEDELFQIEPELHTEQETAVSTDGSLDGRVSHEKKIINMFLQEKDGLQYDW